VTILGPPINRRQDAFGQTQDPVNLGVDFLGPCIAPDGKDSAVKQCDLGNYFASLLILVEPKSMKLKHVATLLGRRNHAMPWMKRGASHAHHMTQPSALIKSFRLIHGTCIALQTSGILGLPKLVLGRSAVTTTPFRMTASAITKGSPADLCPISPRRVLSH